MKEGFLEVGMQTYGGGLWHTWFDRDLAVVGRILIKQQKDGSDVYTHKLVRIQESIMRIPTLAIYLDKSVLEGFKFNAQSHVVPVLETSIKNELQKLVGENGIVDQNDSNEKTNLSSNKHHLLLLKLIADQAGCEPDEICDSELQLCDTQPSVIGGALKVFILSGRLNNHCMSFCSLKELIDVTYAYGSLDQESGVRMVALFDHEEVGSNSAQGTGSPAMFDALSRITQCFSSDSMLLAKAIQRSFVVS